MTHFQIKLGDDWKNFSDEEDKALRSSFGVGHKKSLLTLRGQQYEYNFKEMTQKNVSTGKVRQIRSPRVALPSSSAQPSHHTGILDDQKKATEARYHSVCVYLPVRIHGATVLVEVKSGTWRATNEHLGANAPGVAYRVTKNLQHKTPEGLLPWSALVDGVDAGDGWVCCQIPNVSSDVILPMASSDSEGVIILPESAVTVVPALPRSTATDGSAGYHPIRPEPAAMSCGPLASPGHGHADTLDGPSAVPSAPSESAVRQPPSHPKPMTLQALQGAYDTEPTAPIAPAALPVLLGSQLTPSAPPPGSAHSKSASQVEEEFCVDLF